MPSPTITVTMKTARFPRSAHPIFAVTGAARPKTPMGATQRIQ